MCINMHLACLYPGAMINTAVLTSVLALFITDAPPAASLLWPCSMNEVSGPHMSDQMPQACGMACASFRPWPVLMQDACAEETGPRELTGDCADQGAGRLRD